MYSQPWFTLAPTVAPVAHGKALAGKTVNEAAAARGAKERNVAPR